MSRRGNGYDCEDGIDEAGWSTLMRGVPSDAWGRDLAPINEPDPGLTMTREQYDYRAPYAWCGCADCFSCRRTGERSRALGTWCYVASRPKAACEHCSGGEP